VKKEEKRGLCRSDEQAKPCRSASVSNGLALCIDILLAASYSLSFLLPAISLTSYSSPSIVPLPAAVPVTLRAVLTTFQTSPSYSSRPTRYHPHRILLARIVTTSYLLSSSQPAPSLTSYLSLCILQLPGVCHSESCTNNVTKLAIILAASYSLSSSPHLTRSHTRHILLAIVLTAGVLIAILLIVVVLIASCRICQRSFVSDMQSNATCVKTALLHVMIVAMGVKLGAFAVNAKCVVAYIDVHTVDIKNRTELSHYAWNPLRVCGYDLSIWCDVPRLGRQHDRAAMTHVVRTRPVGKSPDTATSRWKIP